MVLSYARFVGPGADESPRNMSRASHANRTTRRWASSLGCLTSMMRFIYNADREKCNWVVEDTAPSIRLPSTEKSAQPDGVGPKSNASSRPIKVSYLTEQTSHHPPVSAFFIACPEKGILARGFDQLSAKFTGTSVKVTPGAHNLGIFITLEKWDNEEYQLTHPAAHLGGFLRGEHILSHSAAAHCSALRKGHGR